MNIAVILPSLANKGPILVARDVIDYLLENDNRLNVDVYYFDEGPSIDFKCPTFKIDFFKGFDFDKYDILHSHMLRPDAFLIWHRHKIQSHCITTLHVYMYLDLMYSYNKVIAYVVEKIWLWVISKFSAIVVLSLDMKNYYSKMIPNSNFRIINNGRNVSDFEIDPAIVDSINRKFENKILLGVIALLTKRKGVEQLIYCLELDPTLGLLIIGDGPERRYLEALAKKLKVVDRVLFLGMQDNAHIYNKLIDIYILPSRSEGLPMSLIEAAYYGKPSVCSNLPLFLEFFDEEELVTYELDNIESLNNSIKLAWQNRLKFSSNINKKYLSNYHSNMMGFSYLRLYVDLINNN